jgi:hypothetical protein
MSRSVVTVIKFPRDYQAPPPEPEPQLELWPDLPKRLKSPNEPLSKRELKKLLAAMAADLDSITEYVESVKAGIELLNDDIGEGGS